MLHNKRWAIGLTIFVLLIFSGLADIPIGKLSLGSISVLVVSILMAGDYFKEYQHYKKLFEENKE